MARDYISLGSSPYEEECAQVGELNYRERARKEAAAYMAQLIRTFGPPPSGARLAVMTFPHDFGAYYEVVVYYEDDDEDAVRYAHLVEEGTPAEWDEQAQRELGLEE